ncbi:carcinoembryonic antigen-related cell adhesion molecule 1-like isoform X2 [Archocentrus centrarchus]|uniref:carcinoembryonic antigen-related cell adhesion molecule 1-like isoform X2 n=1 Tax=Archocentrus centrarchus TaxID=63155 RepID=UPI0011EA1F55|nr:carcinoembryonic antigen-related cell adhesion molecule 1-like isoform X2 [Archocentrus centrarchus]
MSATMRLPTLLIFFFQVLDVKTAVQAKSPEEVFGYLGETITLPSGANPSWTLTKIEWSIFKNNTWIATYSKGKTNTDRVPRYKGRLSLNTTSGDLTIHSLTTDDAREYNVDLLHSEDTANKIILRVKQKLQQPSIQIITSTSIENGCLMVMRCSSRDNGVNLSWSVEPRDVLTISKSNPSDSSVQLFAFVNTTQNFARFTCNSSQNTESVSSNPVTPKCDVLNCPTQPSPTTETQPRARFSLLFFTGGFVGGVLAVIIVYFFGGKRKTPPPKENVRLVSSSVINPVESSGDSEKIKSACQDLKGKLCSPV